MLLRDGVDNRRFAKGQRQVDLKGASRLPPRPELSPDKPERAASILILGKPGSGKTTVLRDICRKVSEEQVPTLCAVPRPDHPRQKVALSGLAVEKEVDLNLVLKNALTHVKQ